MKLLFVCTGNTCRSPMAEGITRKLARERGLPDFQVTSAGTSASEAAPASQNALLVGEERHLDIGEHRSKLVTPELVLGSDLILTMGPQHLARVEALGGRGKAYLLSDYASKGASRAPIVDPYGGSPDVYRGCADALEAEIRRVLDRITETR